MTCDKSKKLQILRDNIGTYPDFPKPGVIFRDIFSILRNPEACKCLFELLIDEVSRLKKIDVIVGLESRGFLFGLTLAQQLGIGFVPIRKKGKLPGKLKQVSFTLEYGTDTFEIQEDSITKGQNVLIVDDLIATGGSLSASCALINELEAEVVACLLVIELKGLDGRKKITAPVISLLEY